MSVWVPSLVLALGLMVPLAAPARAAEGPSESEQNDADDPNGSGSKGPAEGGSGPASGTPPADTVPAPGPPSRVTVEGALPYIPTSNTIATRLPVPLKHTPANVGTVSELLIREQNDIVLGDALRNVSGLNVQTISAVGDLFLMRGFDSLTSGLVLTDGASEPEVTFYQMYNVERVEVLKGPGGFLYGSNPMAGAVNIVRRQPVSGTFGRAGVTAGSFATYDTTVDYNYSSDSGQHALRLNSAWRQSDGYRDDKFGRIMAVNPAYTWRVSDRTSLNFNLEYADADYSPDAGVPVVGDEIADVPRTQSYQSPFDESDQGIGRLQIDFETKLSEAWTIRNKAYYRGLDWDTDGTLFNGVFPNFDPTSPSFGRLEVSRSLVLLDDRQRFVGNQFEAVTTASTGGVEHKILMGIETARFGDDFTLDVAALPNIDLEDPMETASEPLILLPGQSAAGDSRSLVLAPYVIDQIKFSERFRAMAAARLDVIDFEDAESDTDREDSEVSPMGGVIYSLNASLSLYANAGSSFSPPSSRVAGEREPEESVQYEVGAKIDALGDKLHLTVAGYRMERENIAIPDDNGFTQQAGDQRSLGAELELAAEPIAGLRTFLSYAYNDSELTSFTERVIVGFDPITFQPIFGTVDRSGNAAAFAPRHIANLWVSHRFEGGIGLAGGARYVSSQFIAEDNAFAIDGYVTYDAAVSWEHGDWEATLNVKNLTDREYETRGFGSTSVLPAAGIGYFGGVHYRF